MPFRNVKQPVGIQAPVQSVAPVVAVVLGASILINLPELGLLLMACAYVAPREYKDKVLSCVQSVTKQQRVAATMAAVRPKAFCILIALLLIVLLFEQAQWALVIGTAIAFLALEEFGTNRDYKSGKTTKVTTGRTSTSRIHADCNTSYTKMGQAKPLSTGGNQSKGNASAAKDPAPVKFPRVFDQERKHCWWLNGPRAEDVARQRTRTFEEEIQRIVTCSSPTARDGRIMYQLKSMAERSIAPLVPEAKVTCTAQVNFDVIGAMGEKPELNMVVTVDRDVLYTRLAAVKKDQCQLVHELLNKTATKVLAERMEFVRFWRSQFSSPEPALILLVPPSNGIFAYPLILNFTVNIVYPERLDRVLSKVETQTKELILVVLRWARQRCVCNIARGQPTLYMWSLLVLYFSRHREEASAEADSNTSALLMEFFRFYMARFGSNKSFSVCFSSEVAAPSPESTLWGIPYIEDALEEGTNLATNINADGIARVKEELARATKILADGAQDGKLSELLQRWFPATASFAEER